MPAKLDLAQSRLAKFAVVGFLDDLPSFQNQYLKVFGVSLRIKTYNQGRGSKPALTNEQLAKITALTAPDQAIFDTAFRNRFDGLSA